MMLHGARTGAEEQPRVLQIQISRYAPKLPAPNESLRFLVAFHVEGSASTWQRNTVLPRVTEQRILAEVEALRLWSARLGMTERTARAATVSLGRTLRDVFLGRKGARLIESIRPTAILFFVDETVINLPWEFMCDREGAPLFSVPLSRVVTSRVVPEPGRDPSAEDPEIRILVVENPTEDLVATEQVVDVLAALAGDRGDGVTVDVTVLRAKHATRRRFREAVDGQAFDIVHFAGHGLFDPSKPSDGVLVLNDGPFVDEDVFGLGWTAPPFVVFNSSCESGRAAPGRRIVLGRRRSNGLPSAFLARGVEAYLGHYFLVSDGSAASFAKTFYESLFESKNLGQAVLDARTSIYERFETDGDVTAFGLTFFGDSGTAKRADLATAD